MIVMDVVHDVRVVLEEAGWGSVNAVVVVDVVVDSGGSWWRLSGVMPVVECALPV